MGHVGLKTRSIGKILEKPFISSKKGHVRLKTRSLGQISEKPCVHYGGHIFSPIIMKPGQNICLEEVSHEFENVSCRVKNKVTWSNLSKTLCTL